MTFSIVAYSASEQAWGVAVASKFLAAAAVVNWARADAGAVATQAFAKVSFGSTGLDLMAAGLSAEDALAKAEVVEIDEVAPELAEDGGAIQGLALAAGLLQARVAAVEEVIE